MFLPRINNLELNTVYVFYLVLKNVAIKRKKYHHDFGIIVDVLRNVQRQY